MKIRTNLSLLTKKLSLLLILFGLVTGGWAQVSSGKDKAKVWTLEDCIATAKANNIQVQRQHLQANAAKSDLKLAKMGTLPSLSGWYAHNLNSGKTVNFEDYSYINTTYQDGNAGVQARLALFQGMQGWNRIQQGKMALQSAEQQKEAMEIQITLSVVTAYLQILMSQEMVMMAEDKLQVSKDQINQAEEFFKVGRVAQSEVLVIKSQEAQDELDLITRKGDLELANLILRQILNLEGNSPISIAFPQENSMLPFSIPAVVDVYDYAKTNQPRIKAAQSFVMANEAALKVARGATMPDLSLSGVMYSRYSELGVNPLDPEGIYSYPKQLGDNTYSQANIRLNIPILSRYGNGTQRMISQAKVSVLDSRLLLEQEKKTMREEIQQAGSLANTALARLNASEQAMNSAKAANDIIREQFQAGIVTAIDLRVSSNQFLLATTTYLQARYELVLRSKVLDVYQGKAVTL